METKKTSPGNGDHREGTPGTTGTYYSRARGRTVSGAVPDPQDDNLTPLEAVRLLWGSPSSPESPSNANRPSTSPKSGSGSKRHSGGLLSRFKSSRDKAGGEERASPLSKELRLGSRGKDREATSPIKATFDAKAVEDYGAASPTLRSEKENEDNGGAMSAALKQTNKTRRRRGSLRKTAMLGTRRMVSEERERNGALSPLQTNAMTVKQLQRPTDRDDQHEEAVIDNTSPVERLGGEFERNSSGSAVYLDSHPQSPERQSSSFEISSISTGSATSDIWPEPAAVSATRLALLNDHRSSAARPGTSSTMTDDTGSPLDMKSPTSQASFISKTTTSTSDDDVITLNSTFTRKSTSTSSWLPVPPLSSTATSYFPSLPRPLTPKGKRRSPLSSTLPLSAANTSALSTEPHDYTETEYWGWVILFVTWLTFTVGMGSCLEIWSWAWDVGETPYAPPELEDDPTLPIVGYYPALMVLTGVVAWVWITVAWVGMKYFRHAKIEV